MSLLPVASILPELLHALQQSPQVLLNAPTGAGKSTWLPLQILRDGGINGRILLLEPRRLAARNVAQRLAELLGASPEQVCVAAEIGMEHNLGLTCDPVAGQVQVPCIERNAIASVKAINAARMAMRRTSEPRVSLDKVIETMYETGKDMNAKYRETSRGGLAIKVQCD